MKKLILPFLVATVIMSCNNDQKGSADTTSTNSVATSATKTSTAGDEDGPAIATIETDTYSLKIHKAFSFMKGTSGPNDGYKPKEGNQYIALDVSVKNKIGKPIDMAGIMSMAKVTDESGAEYGKMIAALGAYAFTNSDPKQQKELDALRSATFGPQEFHRAIAICFEAPQTAKDFILTLPATEDLASGVTKQAKFSVNQ